MAPPRWRRSRCSLNRPNQHHEKRSVSAPQATAPPAAPPPPPQRCHRPSRAPRPCCGRPVAFCRQLLPVRRHCPPSCIALRILALVLAAVPPHARPRSRDRCGGDNVAATVAVTIGLAATAITATTPPPTVATTSFAASCTPPSPITVTSAATVAATTGRRPCSLGWW